MTTSELNNIFDKIAVTQAENAALQKRTDAQMAKTDEQFARTEAQMARTDAQMAKTDASLERIGIRLGNISDNNRSNAEDYFYNSLLDKPELGGIGYDTIVKNFTPKSKRGQGEFDIVMYNGENIALIECKYKAHKSDVEKLITKQVESFKKLFPIYSNHKFYLGIASFSFYNELEEFAKENGVAILKQKGEVMEIESDNLKAY